MSTAAAEGASEGEKPAPQRALAAIPVVLTILATVLAGLSSSEMTRSMYFRSLAAQHQSKAGSQWAFFQAKRIRGTTLESMVELVRTLGDAQPFDTEGLRQSASQMEEALDRAGEDYRKAAERAKEVRQKLDAFLRRDETQTAFRFLTTTDLPAIEERRVDQPAIAEAVAAIRARKTEAQTTHLVAPIDPIRLEEAIEVAESNAEAFDVVCRPVTQTLKALDDITAELNRLLRDVARGRPTDDARQAARSFASGVSAARQDFNARRYAREARYNQDAGELYELLVRRASLESDRHRNRSKNFFYAMLCAQAGVTVASFALARSRKSLFWSFAGGAGLIAVAFGAYVYLAM